MDRSMALAGELGDTHGGEEARLIRAAQDDRSAFAPLYARYRDRVYAYLRTRTLTAEDAADLTQQVFLQAIDALPRYRPGRAPFAAWLFRIARNAAINHHRRHRDQIPWDLLPASLQPRTEGGLEAHALQRERLEALEEVLCSCNAVTREMLALHFAAGLSIAETARVVGKSEPAVKKHISRTIRALKEQYHERS
jgi:RNA polymerase sigma-70 factor (ECF subfamily)